LYPNIKERADMSKVLLSIMTFFIVVFTGLAFSQAQPITVEEDLVPEELQCLALNIYFEAGIESNAGKMAVANVVFNRVASSKFPNTICEVVHQGPTKASWKDPNVQVPIRNKCQFSWWCDGKADDPYEGVTWDKSKQIATTLYTLWKKDELTLDITDGAVYYHADYVTPFWAKSFVKTAKIDTHIFYK
jgi:spore germination cell wall hydrolase CwlJ-like protein